MTDLPLVSVGIPTYNRPDGLLRTIQQIAAQTYRNLEIIVSNNASTNPLVATIADRCAQLDPRIRVVHQARNLGLVANFKFVLREARADYFLWAADDDEWNPRFIATCMQTMLHDAPGTVMTGFVRRNRALGVEGPANLPRMTGQDRFADAMAFYGSMPHSMFYGLHRRRTLDWYLADDDSANDDELLILRQILDHGVVTLPDLPYYVAGMDDASYQIKIPKEAEDRYFNQLPRLQRFLSLIAGARVLDDVQRLALLQRVLLSRLHFVTRFEAGMRRPNEIQLAQHLLEFLSEIDVRQLPAYTAVIRAAKAHAATRSRQEEAMA